MNSFVRALDLGCAAALLRVAAERVCSPALQNGDTAVDAVDVEAISEIGMIIPDVPHIAFRRVEYRGTDGAFCRPRPIVASINL